MSEPILIHAPSIVPSTGAPGGIRVHLLAEGAESSAAVIEVPPGVSALRFRDDGMPALAAAGAPDAGLLVEQVRSPDAGGRVRLLLVNLEGTTILWNDQRAPHCVLLGDGDRLRVGDGPLLEVALHHVPRIGPAPDGWETPCPFCRTPVTGSRVYECPHCGALAHYAPEGGEDALRCAGITPQCGGCARPIHLTAGYLGEPELLDE